MVLSRYPDPVEGWCIVGVRVRSRVRVRVRVGFPTEKPIHFTGIRIMG